MDGSSPAPDVNSEKLDEFVGKVMGDISGSFALLLSFIGDRLTDNLPLLGQIFYSASTLICTPASRAQEVGLALGAQAGEKRLTAVLREAGFTGSAGRPRRRRTW